MIAAQKHAVYFDVLRADIDRSALLLDKMRRMQIVQRVDDVHGDVGRLTCARMPDGGPCDSDEQLSGSRCFAKSMRRTDHRIRTVQHSIALEMCGKAEVIHEAGKWLKRSCGEALHLGCSHSDPLVSAVGHHFDGNHLNLSGVIETLQSPYFGRNLWQQV